MINKCYGKYSFKFKLLSLVVFVCFSFFSSGCAVIINGSSQIVMLNTDPTGATLFVGGRTVESPTSLELMRDQDYYVRAVKEGYEEAQIVIYRRLSDQFYWGFILCGIFECISFVSGAAYELNPANINLLLREKSFTPEVEPQSVQPTSKTTDKKSLDKIEEELKKLDKMKADGLITNEDYSNLKKKIIDKY